MFFIHKDFFNAGKKSNILVHIKRIKPVLEGVGIERENAVTKGKLQRRHIIRLEIGHNL